MIIFRLKPESRTIAASVCLLLIFSGCGGVGQNASVSGKVDCDGTPLPAGLVVFTSESTTCSGKILDGKYEIFCKGKRSVPLHEYAITIFPPDNEVKYNPETNSEEPVPSSVDPKMFPKKYRSKSTSGLKFSPQQGRNEFDITLNK